MGRLVIAAAALLLVSGSAASSAWGQSVTDGTSCAAINAAMATEDPATMLPAVNYIRNTLTALDKPYLAKGEPGIIARMSDDGRTSTAAAASVHCKLNPVESVREAVEFVYDGIREMNVAFGLAPPPRPDYSRASGLWTIDGRIAKKGIAVACKMERDAGDGSFGYMVSISSDADVPIEVHTAIVVPTDGEEGSKPTVTVVFDTGRPIVIQGVVVSGHVMADLADISPEELGHRLALLKDSKRATVTTTTDGGAREITRVDLAGSRTAVDENAICLKVLVSKVIGH
jgi:hypothetical protein